MATTKKEEPKKEIPEIIIDPSSNKKYVRGKFLGKGGFARCYELTDSTKEILAGKIVSKSLLVKQHQKEKMSQEISIHRSLQHRHIVGFHGFFEDSDNVYIVLELCRRRTLYDMHEKKKWAVRAQKKKVFRRQLIISLYNFHGFSGIFRKISPKNISLYGYGDCNVSAFPGRTSLKKRGGSKKPTLCGTPNYIAPEILCKKGHSYEVDIWSIGCIMYTLLVGKPPFETQTLKDTYMRIKKNEYHIPSRIGPLARSLIQKLLQGDPTKRPNVGDILQDDFMTMGYIPTRLPTSCLTMAPRFDARINQSIVARKPLLEINTKDGSPVTVGSKDPKKDIAGNAMAPPQKNAAVTSAQQQQLQAPAGGSTGSQPSEPSDCWLKELYAQITSVVASKPDEKENAQEDEAEDPAAVPMIWVSKWVDYSDKYGLGYQLCDDSIGVLFNDFTKLLLLADGDNIHYIERSGTEHYHQLKEYPATLNKKVTLLRYFRNYMNEHLLKAAASMCPRDGDELARIPSLRTYFRTRSAIILHLTNGTLQINFFEDHSKVILCPLMGAVTYINDKRCFRTYKLDLLEQYGCQADLANRLRYARNMIQKLMVTKSTSSTKSSMGSTAQASLQTAS
ncbi:unnamed protein product, partial [Meganyctiphanes norvegica]